MANAKKCDRCGKYYEPYNTDTGDDFNSIRTIRKETENNYYSISFLDICPDCREQFNKWIKNKDAMVEIIRHTPMGTTCE